MTAAAPLVVPPGEGEAGTGTVSRALHLVTVLADAGGPVTVKAVSQRMGLPPSTAHRLLQLLRQEGFVEADEASRTYAIGPRFYRVAAKVVSAVTPTATAIPFIQALAGRFDETVLFGLFLRKEGALSFAARADGDQMLRYHVEMDRPLSLVWGASGKAILAHLQPGDVAEILRYETSSPATGAEKPALEALEAELRRIRALGYAVSEGEKLPDARGIAAPVFGTGGVLGSITLTSPKARLPHASIDTIGQEIAKAARALSDGLGAPSP